MRIEGDSVADKPCRADSSSLGSDFLVALLAGLSCGKETTAALLTATISAILSTNSSAHAIHKAREHPASDRGPQEREGLYT
jgi:hypothetical protein